MRAQLEEMERLGFDLDVISARARRADEALTAGDRSGAELALREAIILCRAMRQLRLIETRRRGEAVTAGPEFKASLADSVSRALEEVIQSKLSGPELSRAADNVAAAARQDVPATDQTPAPAQPDPNPARIADLEAERDKLRDELRRALDSLAEISDALSKPPSGQ